MTWSLFCAILWAYLTGLYCSEAFRTHSLASVGWAAICVFWSLSSLKDHFDRVEKDGD